MQSQRVRNEGLCDQTTPERERERGLGSGREGRRRGRRRESDWVEVVLLWVFSSV